MKRTVSISEMADYCQVTAETIRRWIDSGAIPAKRTLGGHRRIEYQDFVSFLEANNLPVHRSEIHERQRILLVGGNAELMKTLSSTLDGMEIVHQMEHAPDSFEAGHKLAKYNPDYIFLVPDTPGLDLHRACKLIREDTATRSSKIVAIASRSGLRRAVNPKPDAPDHFLDIPFSPDDIKHLF